MYKFARCAALGFCLVVLATGCYQSPNLGSQAPTADAGIAIIDLDEIARQLGSDKQIVSAIKQRQAALNTKLTELAQSYSDELNKQKEAIEAKSQDSAVQLASYQQQVNQSFSTAKAQAQQNLSQHRSQLVQQFKDAVRPAARRVAERRGFNVIVTKQDSLLYEYDADHDITDEVIQVLRASSTPKTASQQAPAKRG